MQSREVSTGSSGVSSTYLAETRSPGGDGLPGSVSFLSVFARVLLTIHPIDDAESLVRCSPGEDATNGFFVSMFVRETHVPEGTDRNTVTKRKRADESSPKDNDEHQKKPRKRKKAAGKSK